MCLLEAFNSYNYSRCIQSRIGGNMAFCWHCWQHDDSWGGDGTSKRRWRVGNIGAEQDEGITSPEIKGQASHTHTKNKTTASRGPQYLSPVARRPSKGLVLSFVYSVSEWGGMCAACKWACVFVCLTHASWRFFMSRMKRQKEKNPRSATELAVHVLRLLLFVCAYVNGFLPHLWSVPQPLCLLFYFFFYLRWLCSSEAPLRPDKSKPSHRRAGISWELCVSRFDPAAVGDAALPTSGLAVTPSQHFDARPDDVTKC